MYYHGLEFYSVNVGDTLKIIIQMLEEGILTRDKILNVNDPNLEHVCLYKKNEEYDYNNISDTSETALSGWINHCFVFVINPNIKAVKTKYEDTHLVDEWRCNRDILPSEIIGIALPFTSIDKYLNEDYEDEETIKDKKEVREYLPILINLATKLGLNIYDSDNETFTEEIDSQLNDNKKTETTYTN